MFFYNCLQPVMYIVIRLTIHIGDNPESQLFKFFFGYFKFFLRCKILFPKIINRFRQDSLYPVSLSVCLIIIVCVNGLIIAFFSLLSGDLRWHKKRDDYFNQLFLSKNIINFNRLKTERHPIFALLQYLLYHTLKLKSSNIFVII